MTMVETATMRASASRLLPAGRRAHIGLGEHLAAHGPLPLPRGPRPGWGEALLAEVERAGLTGRGGAGFPSARKQRSVAATGERPVLIVNAMEGEPASAKDRALLQVNPHLVLDGAELLAAALDAAKVVVCTPNDRPRPAARIRDALSERTARWRSQVPFELACPDGRYIAGEESALVAAVAGRAGVPAFRPDKAVPLSLGRRPALVHNAETLAHLALIARYGAEWFRELGSPEAPGTCLVTVGGAVALPGVFEVPTGMPVADILSMAGPWDGVGAVLAGGYGGAWLSGANASVGYSPAALKAVGAAMGVGVLAVLPDGGCGLMETARVARFMAAENAGQCGPCVFGLPAIAGDLRLIADGTVDRSTLGRLAARCDAVRGRGACRHPDGVARLVASALQVFATDLAAHVGGRPCAGSRHPSVLPLPGIVGPPERPVGRPESPASAQGRGAKWN